MVSNRFFVQVLVRVLLMIAAIAPLSAIFLRPDLLFTQIILVVIIVVQILELTHFVNRTNRDLSRFLSAVRDGDFSINFSSDERMKSFKSLNTSFKELIDTLKELETEKEAQLHFLNQLVDQIEFGIITFNEKMEIEVINKQAMQLLEIPKIRLWQKVNNPNFGIVKSMLKLPDTSNQLVEYQIGNQQRFLSVSATTITIREKPYRIMSFQDIKSEIQQKEIEAWHKLIRILTHEVMNSVTPLVSLTDTILMLLENHREETSLSTELDEDIEEAVTTIKQRSEGILQFVQDYRKLTRIRKPEKEQLTLFSLASTIETLMRPEAKKKSIEIINKVGKDVIFADQHLTEQVILNLIKNAIEAIETKSGGTITLKNHFQGDFHVLTIEDTGPGIPKEKTDKIFIPFYTTKPEGSGIGLSVCRQIMNLHGGFMEVASEPEKGTAFSLFFPISDRHSSSAM